MRVTSTLSIVDIFSKTSEDISWLDQEHGIAKIYDLRSNPGRSGASIKF